jgi:hypothetical protein
MAEDPFTAFQHMVEDQDAAEERQLAIERTKLGPVPQRDEVARAMADLALSQAMPGSLELGYRTARDANRWFNYRLAVIREIGRGALHLPGHYANLEALAEERDKISEKLVAGNFVFGQTFAALEMRRAHQEERGEPLDPNTALWFERQHAAGLLESRTLAFFKDPAYIELCEQLGERQPFVTGISREEDGNFRYVLDFDTAPGEASYTIFKYSVDVPDPEADMALPAATYQLIKDTEGFRFNAQGADPGQNISTDTFHILDLTEKLNAAEQADRF